VNPLLELLKNKDKERLAKLQAIIALGDLAMNCPIAFTQNFQIDVLKILDSACKQSLSVSAFSDDEDMLKYLSQLRETLVDCYTSLIHGITMSNLLEPLKQIAPSLILFLGNCTDKSLNPDKAFVKSVVGLIGDLANLIGKECKELIK